MSSTRVVKYIARIHVITEFNFLAISDKCSPELPSVAASVEGGPHSHHLHGLPLLLLLISHCGCGHWNFCVSTTMAAFQGMHVSHVFHLWNIAALAMGDYQESVTTRQIDTQTDRQLNRCWTKWSTCAAMLRRRHNKECMYCLRNIAMHDYQEIVTTGNTHRWRDRQTYRRQTRWSLCVAMLHRQHQNCTQLWYKCVIFQIYRIQCHKMKVGNHMQALKYSEISDTHISWNLFKRFTKNVYHHLPDYCVCLYFTII